MSEMTAATNGASAPDYTDVTLADRKKAADKRHIENIRAIAEQQGVSNILRSDADIDQIAAKVGVLSEAERAYMDRDVEGAENEIDSLSTMGVTEQAGANETVNNDPTMQAVRLPPFVLALQREINAIAQMLVSKNVAYGNSALDPIRCFSKADPIEQIKVRIDDKISRIMRGAAAGDDVVMDLIGYLILLRIAQHQ